MFHIFRWHREHKNGKKTTSNISSSTRYKRHHTRRSHLQIPRESQSIQQLIHATQPHFISDHDKLQVVMVKPSFSVYYAINHSIFVILYLRNSFDIFKLFV